ncbi:MAG: biopolymer transporter ExbD [Verrucomicrobia bacterium]|nr:biopolymer transporter ExbD [Verrucomicrobiota bacterium]
MARSFSKPNRLHVLNELNVTPMLDLCFVLLIIFMIATPVLEQTTAVNLPKADKGAGKAPDTKAQHRIVSIDRNGGLSLGARAVTTAQLEAEFAALAALPEAEQPIVRIRGDGALSYQKIIDVLSLAKAKGLTKAALDTETR